MAEQDRIVSKINNKLKLISEQNPFKTNSIKCAKKNRMRLLNEKQ